jgi:hypothetical protein
MTLERHEVDAIFAEAAKALALPVETLRKMDPTNLHSHAFEEGGRLQSDIIAMQKKAAALASLLEVLSGAVRSR